MTGDMAVRRVAIVRVVTFAYAAGWLVLRGPYVVSLAGLPARRFQPVGLLTVLDGRPPKLAVLAWCAVTLSAAILAAAGRCLRVTAPVAALGMLGAATLASSFGQVFHTEHLLVLHMLVLAAHTVVSGNADSRWQAGWAIASMQAITAATYLVAGVTKVRLSGIDWVTGDVLRSWVATDNLRKHLLDDWYSPLGGWLAGVPWIWPPIAAATLVVELGAPLAALAGGWQLHSRSGRRVSRLATRTAPVWVAAAWAFHIGVLATMAIVFPYQLSGVAYAAFVPLERVDWRALARSRGRARARA